MDGISEGCDRREHRAVTKGAAQAMEAGRFAGVTGIGFRVTGKITIAGHLY